MISIEISFKDSTNVSSVILCFIKYAVRKTMWSSARNMNFVSEKSGFESKFVHILAVKAWTNLLTQSPKIYSSNHFYNCLIGCYKGLYGIT